MPPLSLLSVCVCLFRTEPNARLRSVRENRQAYQDIIAWQNELLAYRDEKRPYSQTYLKTVHNQLFAIFNHAVRYYDLRSNPAAKAGNMGSEEHKEMQEYISMLYGLKKKDRIFTVTKSYLHHEMDRGAKA